MITFHSVSEQRPSEKDTQELWKGGIHNISGGISYRGECQ